MFSNPLPKIYSLKKSRLFIYTLALLSVAACKKDKGSKPSQDEEVIETPNDKSPTVGTTDQMTKDSIFLYARQVYLWWNKIPDYDTFNPRQYGSLTSELFQLTRYPVNTATGKPYEYSESDPTDAKYSYILDIYTKNPVAAIRPSRFASVDLESNGFDLGLFIGYAGSKSNFQIYLAAVYPNSDAAAKGLERGDRITSINGVSYGSDYDNQEPAIDQALFNSSSVSLTVKKYNGETVNVNLTKKSYKSSPIYKDSVYTSGTKKIGYMAYGRFSYAADTAKLNATFAKFKTAGITDLIVDLRYNGGGYVSAAEYMMNLIAPSRLNGTVMYTEHYNQLMQEKKATILKNQPLQGSLTYADYDYSVKNNTYYFSKIGNLETVQNVVFIVSSRTASASELVINGLRPHLNIKLVGSKTYGKPVGFFPIRISNYDVYMSMFETRNSKDEGGYYSGIPVDYASADNFLQPFGSVDEDCFKAAYNYLTKGTFVSATKNSSDVLAKPFTVLQDEKGNVIMRETEFKGMVESRIKSKH